MGIAVDKRPPRSLASAFGPSGERFAFKAASKVTERHRGPRFVGCLQQVNGQSVATSETRMDLRESTGQASGQR